MPTARCSWCWPTAGRPRPRRGRSTASSRRARISAASPAARTGWAWSRPTRARCCSPFRLDRAERTLRVGAARAALLRDGRGGRLRGAVLGRRLVLRHRLARARAQEAGPPAVAAPRLPGAAGAGRRSPRCEIVARAGCRCSAPTRSWAAHYHRRLDQAERAIDVEGIARPRGHACCSACAARAWTARRSCSRSRWRTCSSSTASARPQVRAACAGAWARAPASAISPWCRTACWC